MDIEDAALMYEGWGDEMLYQQQIARKMTMIIADTVNRTFGGKGVMKNQGKIWPLPGDTDKTIRKSHLDLLKKFKELDLAKGIKPKERKVKMPVKDFPVTKNRNGKR